MTSRYRHHVNQAQLSQRHPYSATAPSHNAVLAAQKFHAARTALLPQWPRDLSSGVMTSVDVCSVLHRGVFCALFPSACSIRFLKTHEIVHPVKQHLPPVFSHCFIRSCLECSSCTSVVCALLHPRCVVRCIPVQLHQATDVTSQRRLPLTSQGRNAPASSTANKS